MAKAATKISKAKIEVDIHESASQTRLFKKQVEVTISKPEIFKYGVFMYEVPKHIRESDFRYLQSKVPYLEGLYTDYLAVSADSLINLSTDDRIKKLMSETIGVAVGLKYTMKLLGTKAHKFKKIPPVSEGKYLDYSIVEANRLYEIETKGTVSTSVNAMIDDILAKKANTTGRAYLRFGTITKIKNNAAENRVSSCLIVDEPPDDNANEEQDPDIRDTILANYGLFLSYILDSKYYNRFIRPVLDKRRVAKQIDTGKFYGTYVFKGKEYLGECFDYRLIENNIRAAANAGGSREVGAVFKRITERVGRTKFFLGLDKRLVEAINKGDYGYLSRFETDSEIIEEDGSYEFLDTDGILVVKSRGGSNKQLDLLFPEKKVESRVRLYASYVQGEAHRCGAPCRSPQKEGEPCQKLTYRSHCYFHR
jgi:hypothetical protein